MSTPQNESIKIIVGMASCGIAAGAVDVYIALKKKIQKEQLPIHLAKTGCIGACFKEPLVEVKMSGLPAVIYGDITVNKIQELFERHIKNREIIKEWAVLGENLTTPEMDLFQNQIRIDF